MSKLGKLEGVKLIKVCCDTDVGYLSSQGWHFEGIAVYSIGMKRYKCKFIAGEKLYFKCGFLEGGDVPQERLQREALLVLIYGEIKKFLGRQEILQFFKKRREEEEEEKRKKEREKKEKKRIALGEQISKEIRKWLIKILQTKNFI